MPFRPGYLYVRQHMGSGTRLVASSNKTTTRQRAFARVKYVRTKDEWRLYWMRADLKWHLYEPAPIHDSLQDALAVVDQDHYGCFFG
jgi:hypothetical protein